MLFHYLQADQSNSPSDIDSDAVVARLQQQMLQLWQLHGGESKLARHNLLKNRAADVLREVARCGWDDYRSICEEATEAARQLWHRCEMLVKLTAEVDGTEGEALLCESKGLLKACDLMVESEAEVVHLMDLGIDDYRSAHQHNNLCWQRSFAL
jgi:hypothetical protein